MKKKVASALIATGMMLSVFAGGMVQAADDPVTISMLYNESATAPYQEDWMIMKLIEEYAGVKLDVQSVPSSDYETKRQVVYNSGNIPDIISCTFPTGNDAMSGLLLPISDYMDQLPNFQKYIEDNGLQELWDNTKMSDGKCYYLPVKAKNEVMQDHQWVIRKDILDENGLEMPTNLQELHDVAVKLKEIYPDSTPIGNRFGSANIMAGLASAYGTIAGWTYGDGMYYDRENEEWIFAPTTDAWKDLVTYANTLYADGALDPEFTTVDSAAFEQKIAQGDIFIAYDWAANCKGFNQKGVEFDEDFNMVPMTPPEGYEGKYALQWNNAWEQAWVLPATVADKEYFPELLKFIDWCYTDEAATLLTFGIEGETYEVNDAGECVWIDPDADYYAEYGLVNNSLTVRMNEDYFYANQEPEVSESYKICNELNAVPIPNPNGPLDADQTEEISIAVNSVKDLCSAKMEAFIFGQESLDNWDSFVAECEATGSTQIQQMYDEASGK